MDYVTAATSFRDIGLAALAAIGVAVIAVAAIVGVLELCIHLFGWRGDYRP